MPRDPSGHGLRLAQSLAFSLIAALATGGCGADNQSGETTPVAKEATRRQADMYNFMKEKGKVKDAPKAAPKGAPKPA